MNILLLTASFPYPAFSGGALRVYSLIRVLHGLGHRITLLAFDNTATNWRDTPLAELCAEVETVTLPHRSKAARLKTLLLSGEADVAHRLYSEPMLAALKRITENTAFDLIQAEGIEMAWLLPHAKKLQPAAKLCFDTFNAEYQLQRVIAGVDFHEPKRWPMAAYSWVQSRRIARFERDMGRLAAIVIAVSPEDAAALTALFPEKSVPVVPSAISVADYAETEAKPLGKHAIIFTGKMDYRPNVDAALWFADTILPRIHQALPDATFHIVGQQPHPRLDRLRDNPGIEITGFVPSVVPYLRGAAVYVAPLRMGSGTRLKLLEAMAAGCAIVATPTAAAGLLPDALSAMRIASGIDQFTDIVVGLLNDAGVRRFMGQQASAAVAAYYDWTAVSDRLRHVYKEAGLG